MIARLTGKLILKQPPLLLIDVNGVGYEVEAPMSTFYELPEPGQNVTLVTHLTIRDDAHILYGFSSESERSLFRSLIRVSGVGPKMALTILSGISAPDFVLCVQCKDAVALTRLPGIGKKTAERLIVEMQDRLSDEVTAVSATGRQSSVGSAVDDPVKEALSALVALGYKPADAGKMIRAVDADGLRSEEIIRFALKHSIS